MAGTGIQGINERLKNRRVLSGSNEIILADDGDAVVGVVASSGHDDDGLVATFYRHTYKDESTGNWKFPICQKRTFGGTCRLCDTGEGGPPRHRFAFWMWVTSLFKTSAPNDEGWTPLQVERGQTLFERPVRDFRIMQLPVGRAEMNWEMFVDMYEVFGSLDDVTIKVSRKGKALNTLWDISETPRMNPRKCDWNELDPNNKRFDLMPILDYYKGLNNDSNDDEDLDTTSLSDTDSSRNENDDDDNSIINDLF